MPTEMGLQVRNVKRVRNNGVLIEAINEKGMKTIMGNEGLEETKLKVERPKKKNPRIMIYNIPRKMEQEEDK